MLAKVILALIVMTLAQFLLFWMLTHLGVVLLGAAGWWLWSHKIIRPRG
jgi:hypothetical protein